MYANKKDETIRLQEDPTPPPPPPPPPSPPVSPFTRNVVTDVVTPNPDFTP